MTAWERTRIEEPCGSCGTKQAAGAPVFVITIPELSPRARRRIRCVLCAGEPVDDVQIGEWDAKQELPPAVRNLEQFTFRETTRELFDGRMAAAGKDSE